MTADNDGERLARLDVCLRAPADLPRALRPREKLASAGPRVLSGLELIALVVGSGTRGIPVQKIAAGLLRRHGLSGLAGLEPRQWRDEPGLGSAGAARMAACCELGRRIFGAEQVRPVIGGPAAAHREVRQLARARKEHLVGLYLDAQNGLLKRETISVGSLNTTRTHPREILYPAVVHLAMGFILAHNHPSGSLDPSAEDIEFTHAVRRAGELMGIELYDHLIVAAGGYVSLRERGLL